MTDHYKTYGDMLKEQIRLAMAMGEATQNVINNSSAGTVAALDAARKTFDDYTMITAQFRVEHNL